MTYTVFMRMLAALLLVSKMPNNFCNPGSREEGEMK